MAQNLIQVASAGLVWRRRILLVKRGKQPSKGLYAFPGGRIEPHETPEDAVRREILEETRITAGPLTFLETLHLGKAAGDPGSARYRLHVFFGAHDGGTPVAGDDADDAGWFSLEEVEALPMTGSSLRIARSLLSDDTVASPPITQT
ncbi:MAG: NUDIX hydrolase [Rhizobiaceae bacterium]